MSVLRTNGPLVNLNLENLWGWGVKYVFAKDTTRHQWVSHEIVSVYFSIYKSPAYLDEHLSMFHPQFIKKCVEKGSTEEVELGLYILPPTEIQDGVSVEFYLKFSTYLITKTCLCIIPIFLKL